MNLQAMTQRKVHNLLPKRLPDTHKGDYGKVLLLCGSRGYTGAAALAAMGALRTGAGLVYLGVPSSIYEIEAIKLTEPVVFALPDADGKLAVEAIGELDRILPGMDALLIGPGLGRSESVTEVVLHVLRTFAGPVVVDADGINAISQHIDVLRGRTGITVLTPHAGEFSRLGGKADMQRRDAAVKLAQEVNSIVLLKGHNTVITDGETVYVNHTGNPGMAVGGCGDILAGMIVSLLGQKLSALESAAAAAWLHGKAADVCAKRLSQYGMIPGDMLQVLPRLLK